MVILSARLCAGFASLLLDTLRGGGFVFPFIAVRGAVPCREKLSAALGLFLVILQPKAASLIAIEEMKCESGSVKVILMADWTGKFNKLRHIDSFQVARGNEALKP
jgi:hypothetical protein